VWNSVPCRKQGLSRPDNILTNITGASKITFLIALVRVLLYVDVTAPAKTAMICEFTIQKVDMEVPYVMTMTSGRKSRGA